MTGRRKAYVEYTAAIFADRALAVAKVEGWRTALPAGRSAADAVVAARLSCHL